MTDYNKWNNFDPDAVCIEIDTKQSIADSKAKKKKAFQKVAKENEQAIIAAKKNAEALQSQSDVDALLAKGIGGRRRRGKDSSSTSDRGSETATATASDPSTSTIADGNTHGKDSKVSGINNGGSNEEATGTREQKTTKKEVNLADVLNSISDFLFQLLKQVEEVRACTEKKERHLEGYRKAMCCMREIETFSRIKRVTAQTAATAATNNDEKGDPSLPPSISSSMNKSTAASSNASTEIIAELDRSESFLLEQTCTCLCLFALSIGEHALACDTSRFVLRRQSARGVADEYVSAGIWIMRGLALAAMGKKKKK
mmetsp:Transcript_16505/g.27915  ORF Transcript_16505/g.27915 Transcript_16505/m.27915 type:complete len:314 (+) Transcript_16505:75-1016(+)